MGYLPQKMKLPQSTSVHLFGSWLCPSILGNLSYTIVGMVQTKFVGELGPQALAAVGAGQRVMFAMLAILMAVSAGYHSLRWWRELGVQGITRKPAV